MIHHRIERTHPRARPRHRVTFKNYHRALEEGCLIHYGTIEDLARVQLFQKPAEEQEDFGC